MTALPGQTLTVYKMQDRQVHGAGGLRKQWNSPRIGIIATLRRRVLGLPINSGTPAQQDRLASQQFK
jgi:hypothetical protein